VANESEGSTVWCYRQKLAYWHAGW
jgi:hypothetical protein